jgi:alanyl-tRNA synthetase
MKSAEIRAKFINYFKSHGHTHVESSTLVPQNDPTLLFTAAGMVPFKDVFLGKEQRAYRRATSFQKCIRAGGKHNDLENVGYTGRHHTFFEMLGNFSFGDYFKEQAIDYAWKFVTQELKLPIERLYVTVFREDEESLKFWTQQQGVAPAQISRMDEEDNFWSMGDTGPCGPCTEIFYDLGPEVGCQTADCKVGCECDRFIEFWNLVFMQFNRDAAGKLTPLPRPSVDTGAGLERLALVLQGGKTNYETDVFSSIIAKTAKLAGRAYYPDQSNDPATVAFRVVADHSRAAAFLIAEGIVPSNEGRGYVLRRILRRAVRYGRNLGFKEPFMHQVAGFVISHMHEAFPELSERASFIERCILAEEEQFLRTLDHGLQMVSDELTQLKGSKELSGEIAFKLYDTYGFPLDLTALIARERNFTVDQKGFETEMLAQKQRSRKNWKGSGEQAVHEVYHSLQEQLQSYPVSSKFCGYELQELTGQCLAVVDLNSGTPQAVEQAQQGEYDLIFDETPFYAESGGQQADHGKISSDSATAQVIDVQKHVNNQIAVRIKMQSGTITKGDKLHQQVDGHRRALIKRNHTATHLLHDALRRRLGDHVKQAGSLVTPDLLRFDFNHFSALSPAEVSAIEDDVNDQIWAHHPVKVQEKTKDQAVKDGAIAFFGEKYGDKVRVVEAGIHSVELCGGTHVTDTTDIQLFRIVTESAIAAGTRRIVAYTSKNAFEFLRNRDFESRQVRELFKANSTDELLQRIEKLQESERTLRKTIDQMEGQKIVEAIPTWVEQAENIADAKLILKQLPPNEGGVKYLREIAEALRGHNPKTIAVLGMNSPDGQKCFVLVGRHPKNFVEVSAKAIIQKISESIAGRGGGKPDLAQAGGTNPKGLSKSLEMTATLIREALSGS